MRRVAIYQTSARNSRATLRRTGRRVRNKSKRRPAGRLQVLDYVHRTRLLVIHVTLIFHFFVLLHHFLLHLLPFGLLVRR